MELKLRLGHYRQQPARKRKRTIEFPKLKGAGESNFNALTIFLPTHRRRMSSVVTGTRCGMIAVEIQTSGV
jgi:hypothetical protein